MTITQQHGVRSTDSDAIRAPPDSAGIVIKPPFSNQTSDGSSAALTSTVCSSVEVSDSPERSQHHTNSSPDSEKSETSTIRHGHEPFESFKGRLEELCRQVWIALPASPRLKDRIIRLLRLKPMRPPLPPKNLQFEFDRMHGGYNRIIGINTLDDVSNARKKYIIRIPRFKGIARPDRDVAILEYVRKHSSIPVATVVKSDFTANNLLGSSYVIQERIPGLDLQNSDRRFPDLTFEQKTSFTRRFAQILKEILSLRGPSPGQIEPTSKRTTDEDIQLRHFKVEGNHHADLREPDDLSFSNSTPSYEKTLAFFQSQFERWRKVAIGKNMLKVMFMERLSAMAAQMYEAGFLGDRDYCLCHLDLAMAPRNILADVVDGSLAITAILDWDEAVFAPTFVACTPPIWIWAWSDDEDEDESKANETPETTEGQILKNIFEQEVGREFLSYAYRPEYRIARKMFDFALQGLHSSWKMEEANKMIEDWAKLRPAGMPLIDSLRVQK